MIWIYLGIFAILDIYTLIYLHKSNNELKKEIATTRQWCKDIIDSLVQGEHDIDIMISQVIKDINDNKVSNDVINIKNSDKMCEYHMNVYNDLLTERDRLTESLNDIRKAKSDLLNEVKDKCINSPSE